MHEFNRNKYLSRELRASFLILAALVVLAAFLYPEAIPFLIILGLILILVHAHKLKQLYARIDGLADQVETMLNGGAIPEISDSEEGALAILEDEIGKVGTQLNQQNMTLERDKKNLKKAIEDIFHQIRTPLTVANIQLSRLKDEDLSYEERIDLVHSLEEESSRLQWLVESLLKLSQIDVQVIQFKKEKIVCADLIRAAVKPFEIPMELQNQTFEAEVDGVSFEGDFAWTLEAVQNIIKNAMEHTPSGGKIRVIARSNEIFTEMTISDEGPGFSKEDLDKVFQRFYKGSHSSSNSIGIGLALSHAIICAQGGTIQVKNGREGGAQFILRFYKMIV